MKCGLMDFLRGRQGLGSSWVEAYRCQDAIRGLVGPFGATGGRFGAIFHIFGVSHIFRIIFPINTGVAGLLLPVWLAYYYREVWAPAPSGPTENGPIC